ncbi:MAG: excinuclease ABC subunit UvrC [Salinisphaeraceae bacterium]|nr:excinuclease ABC subunit UvrC [Salinisphaeraceae bacterium]
MADEDTKQAFDGLAYAKRLTTRPGVYRMLADDGQILYVGKAHNLRKRVSSYFSRPANTAKTIAMLRHVANIEVTVTRTEDEALVLESTLIKQHRPRYNVALRDDKSFPYVHLSKHEFPQISFRRGRSRPGAYYGPYPSAAAVRDTLASIHRIFRLRQCDDSYFNHRSRPCLQYQIKRCSAPCVAYISADDYARDVSDAVDLLKGRSDKLVRTLIKRMEAASEALEFERAAIFREQIAAIRRLMAKQHVSGGARNADIISAAQRGNEAAVVVVSVRGGILQGHNSFFPSAPAGTEPYELLDAFLGQYYLEREAPNEIILPMQLEDAELHERQLSERAGHRIKLRSRVRGQRSQWLQLANDTLKQVLDSRIASHSQVEQRMLALKESLNLDELPRHMECFDISHTSGESTVASCVVFKDGLADKSHYRRYNIEGIQAGDDYAAIKQAVLRRFSRIVKEAGQLPDVLFIDGGKGQLGSALEALQSIPLSLPSVIGVSKGPDRRAGEEELWLPGAKQPHILPPDSPALHLIQEIRDEAHRFAITGHRGRRAKQRTRSELEDIPGLGPKRRQLLLKTFGGVRRIRRASIDELKAVEGVSSGLAEKIYAHFHGTNS